jgi:hypothetical protein
MSSPQRISPAEAEKLDITVLPETAAEAAGFAKSINRAPGLYPMVDVGAMTLDVCTFPLSKCASATDLYAPCTSAKRYSTASTTHAGAECNGRKSQRM